METPTSKLGKDRKRCRRASSSRYGRLGKKRSTHHINVPLLPKDLNLGLRQPREAEHPDLTGHVVPGPRSALGFQSLTQPFTHLDNAAAHRAQVLFPFREELGVVEDEACDASAVGGWVRDLGTLEDCQLASYVLVGLRRVHPRAGDPVEGTCAFTIQTEVLCEGLCNTHLETLLDKVPDGPRVPPEIT